MLAIDNERRIEEVLKATEGFFGLIDSYVMTVTESLCALESENRQIMERPEILDRKARILESLDVLDRLMAKHRRTVADSDVGHHSNTPT